MLSREQTTPTNERETTQVSDTHPLTSHQRISISTQSQRSYSQSGNQT